jgi:hypothetical protein
MAGLPGLSGQNGRAHKKNRKCFGNFRLLILNQKFKFKLNLFSNSNKFKPFLKTEI